MHGTVIVRLRYIGQLLLAPKHLLSSVHKKVPNEQKCPHPHQAPHNPSVAQALPLSFVCIFAFSPLDDHHKQPVRLGMDLLSKVRGQLPPLNLYFFLNITCICSYKLYL